jgi:hypothetical protein
MSKEKINRRDFIRLAGTSVAATVFMSGCSLVSKSNKSAASGVCPHNLVNDPWPGECREYVDQDGNGICDYSEKQNVNEVDVSEMSGSITADDDVTASGVTINQTVFQCFRGCVYPGECRRYTDENDNSICDYTENISSDQQPGERTGKNGRSRGNSGWNF